MKKAVFALMALASISVSAWAAQIITPEVKKVVCEEIFHYYNMNPSQRQSQQCLTGQFVPWGNSSASRTRISYSQGILPEGAMCTVELNLNSLKVSGVACGE